MMLACIRREGARVGMVRAVGRVGLQRRWYRYDGLPHEKPAPEDSFGPGTVLAIGAIVGGLVTLNWYQSRELVKPSLQRSYPRTSDDRIFAPIPPVQPAPPDAYPIPSFVLFLKDLCNPRVVERFFMAAMNFHAQIRQLLYQLRIEIGLLLFELINGWNIHWIIPL